VLVGNEAIQIYSTELGAFETYAEESGVSYLDPNLNAISKDNKGNIWISTNNGLVVYDPQVALANTELPKVIISKRMLFFEPITPGKNRFRHNKNHISFEFGGFWYQAPENIRYRYKLQNYDYDWSRPTQTRSVTYSNLPSGKYSFILEVSHKPGVWTGSEQAVYSFSIKPPFYKTWWFISLSILVIGSSIFYYVKARLSKLQKDKEHLEKEVVKRTATIQFQKEEIETQRDEIEAQRDEIQRQIEIAEYHKEQVVKQNKDMTDSIEYAKNIQIALFPDKFTLQKVLNKGFCLFKPKDIVSGDFYWVAQIENKSIIVAADCTGHGVPGAFMSIIGINFLNEIVFDEHVIKPNEILNRLRKKIVKTLVNSNKIEEAKDAIDISLIVIDRENMKLEYAGAYNHLYFIRDHMLEVIKADKMPVGISAKAMEPFTNHELDIKIGDQFYMFTDGFVDQFGGPNKKKYRIGSFRELLLDIHERTIEEQKQIIFETFINWRGNQQQVDDVLLIGIRI